MQPTLFRYRYATQLTLAVGRTTEETDDEDLVDIRVGRQSRSVDFITRELTAAGLTIKLDRWNIGAGKRSEFCHDGRNSCASRNNQGEEKAQNIKIGSERRL